MPRRVVCKKPTSPSGGPASGAGQVQAGEGWPAVGSTLQLTKPLQQGCPPAGSSHLRDDRLPRHIRADGESPQEKTNLLVVPLMLSVQRRSGPAFAGVPRLPPARGIEEQHSTVTVRCLRRTKLSWLLLSGMPGQHPRELFSSTIFNDVRSALHRVCVGTDGHTNHLHPHPGRRCGWQRLQEGTFLQAWVCAPSRVLR